MFDRIYKILGPKTPSEIRKQEKQKRMRFPDPNPDPTDDTAPNIPGNLQATNIQDTAITIQFNRSQDDTPPIVYSIEHRANSTGTYSVQTINQSSGTQTGTTGTTISSLQHSTPYQIRVKATDSSTTGTGAGGTNSSQYTTITATTTTPSDTTDPTTPTSLAYSGVTENTADLTWNGSNDNFPLSGLKYKLYISISGNAYVFEKLVNHVGSAGSQQSTTLTGLVPGRQQELYVIAEDAEGNQSSQSNVIDFTTPDNTAPTAPSNLTTSNITETTIDLSWNASSDVSGVTLYKIYQNGSFIDDVNYPNISYTATGLTQNTSYSFYVTALDTAGNVSANSNTTPTVTTLASPAPPPNPSPPSAPSPIDPDNTPYVEYIKIARIDQDGNDNTLTLEALTQITLPFSNGTTGNYQILSTTKYQTYFLYSIAKYGPEPLAADAAILDYNFTSSLPTSTYNFVTVPNSQTLYPTSTTGQNTQLFNTVPITGMNTLGVGGTFYGNGIILKTYPTAQIEAGFNITVSVTSGQFTFRLYKITGGIVENNHTEESALITTGTTSLTLSTTTPMGEYGANDGFALYAYAGAAGGGPPNVVEFSFNSTSNFFTISTAASGSTLPTIPEPYLKQVFYGTDCDVLLNNVDEYQSNPFLQDLDYSTNPNVPVNFNRVLAGTADRGTIPESYYTALSQTNIRYNGSKAQSSDVNIFDPYAGTSSFGEPINIGNFGQSPSVTSLDNVIVEFEWVGGTNPEIPGGSQFSLSNRLFEVSSKELIKIITPDENVVEFGIKNSIQSGSTGGISSFIRTISQSRGDYYQVLNNTFGPGKQLVPFDYGESVGEREIPAFATVVDNTQWVPSVSSFAGSSSYDPPSGYGYGYFAGHQIVLYGSSSFGGGVPQQYITKLGSGYNTDTIIATDSTEWVAEIIYSLKTGNRWFITLLREFEYPVGGIDASNRFTGAQGSELNKLGVFEILGMTQQTFGITNTTLTVDGYNPTLNSIGTNTNASGRLGNLGFLIWKSRSNYSGRFVTVDETAKGIENGAFYSRYATDVVREEFENITKEYGANQTG